MTIKKKSSDRTAKQRVAKLAERKREAGLVPVSVKAWVRKEKEDEARKILQRAKMRAENLEP